MAKIDHGCMTKNADGSNKLIGTGKQCIISTAAWFWKNPCDIKNTSVRTRSQTKNLPTVCIKDYDYYFENRERIKRWITASDSEVYVMKSGDCFYVV